MAGFVQWPDPRLKAKADLRATVDDELKAIGERLLAAAKAERAYGLAAAHIGEIAPVVVVSGEGTPPVLLFNPQVIGVSETTRAGEEGSVSAPGVRVDVDRPDWADVRFMDATGATITQRFSGFLGRVVQHEIDQMNGHFFLDRVSRLKRDMALKKARKLAG